MEAGCVVAAVIENAASGPQGAPGSGDVLDGGELPLSHPVKDDAAAPDERLAEERRPQEPPPSEVKAGDVVDHPVEPLLRSCVSTASMKVKNMKKLTFPRGHFPRLAECAHFHYETVDFGNVQLAFTEGQSEGPKAGLDSKELVFLIQISCQARNWLVRRSYEDFRVLDKHLHLCIYDRRYSQLAELPRYDTLRETLESVTRMLATYLSRFSAIADNKINCGPVLTWMEIDNKGNHLLVSEEASINVPAIAAAHVTKRYIAQATDELTFEVGDIVSVIDMPPKEDTGWWRGKHGFQVGFFPCDCVELINDKIPPSVQSSVPKPVCKKHGKLVTFLRSFMKSRPPPQKLRQRGILRERVFGCDLGEHLHNSGHEVPQVVKSCTEFIERHGVVDGIYRLSGISSNIQKLRHEFDSEQIPDLSRDVFRQDIHSVGSLCKLYFRELPNPLLTYQLYDRFSEAVSAATDEERLVKIHNVIQQLPPPHYRTLEYLMRHLSHLATFSSVTNMHTKNLAIVWAPNLLRSRQIESACFSGTAAFMEVRIQSVVVEFILNNADTLFSPKLNGIIRESAGNSTLSRPKSLLVCSPSTKLLSLEEAQARTQAQLGTPATTPCFSHSDYIEVGEGPGALLGKFHTVLELPLESGKRAPVKAKKSPVGNWLSFFHLGKSHSVSKRKLKRHPSEPNEIKSIALPGGRGDSGTLRSTKSEESLTSLHNAEGEPPSYRRLRPRSTSEAISAGGGNDPRHVKDGRGAPPSNDSRNGAGRAAAGRSPPHPEDDIDLYPPAAGISTLDFDPMSFQCSPAAVTPRLQHGNVDGGKWRKSAGCSSESEPISSPNNNNISRSQSPDLSPVLGIAGKGPAKAPSPKLRKKSFKSQPEGPTADRKDPKGPFQHCSPASATSQASAAADLAQSAQNLPDPGADRLMSSVSVLPPHPSPTSAARKLALALAESARKASGGAPRRSRAPDRRQEAEDRPPRPSVLDLKVYPQELCGPHLPAVSQWQALEQSPVESHCYPHPVRFLPAHLCSEPPPPPPPGAAGQESAYNVTPNVSPLGTGSFDDGSGEFRSGRKGISVAEPTYQSVGVCTPTRPSCSAQSPATSPIYANADSINVFNFRAVLAETSVPASVDEVLPRPPQISSAQRYCPAEDIHLAEDAYANQHPLRQIQAGRTPESRCPRPAAMPHPLLGPKSIFRQFSGGSYSFSGLRPPQSPQYRHSHRGEHHLGCQWQRPEDRGVGHPAIRRARSFHAPQISRYDLAEREAPPPDSMFYGEQEASYQRLVQTGLLPLRPQHVRYAPYPDAPADAARYYAEPFPQSEIPRGQSYTPRSHCSPRRGVPASKDLYIASRDRVVYEAGDADVFHRVVYQPAPLEIRHRNAHPATPPYESAGSSAGSPGRDIVHIRSKSDPGNACLLSAEKKEREGIVLSASAAAQLAERGVVRQLSGVEAAPGRRVHLKDGPSKGQQQQPPLRKVPSLPERSRGEPGGNDQPEPRNRPQAGERFLPLHAAGSYSGAFRRAGRSQSTRESRHHHHHHHHHHLHAKSPGEPELPGSFPAQASRRTQSTKVRPTQYDSASGFYARPKSTRSGKAAAEYLSGRGAEAPRGHRLRPGALDQEAFYQPGLRSPAGVYE